MNFAASRVGGREGIAPQERVSIVGTDTCMTCNAAVLAVPSRKMFQSTPLIVFPCLFLVELPFIAPDREHVNMFRQRRPV